MITMRICRRRCLSARSTLAVIGVGVAGSFGGLVSSAHAQAVHAQKLPPGYVEIHPEATAREYWTVNGRAIIRGMGGGQCTTWAVAKRPDILRRGVEAIVGREIKDRQPQSFGNWYADNWLHNAEIAHIPTGTTPQPGAIMVFQPGIEGATSAGHVAYVTAVNPDGSFTVSQMHAPVLGQVTTETFAANVAQLAGIAFIY